MNPIRVTVLVTNTAWGTGLLGEHGLSFWIDTGSRRLLFDTGQGLAIAGNARALRIELARADAIALSHGHYDHTGGLRYAMSEAKQARLYLHPHALIRRYTGVRSEGREIGLASINEQELR